MTTLEPLYEQLKDLSAAEDFMAFFAVPFVPHVLHTSRLHILQRFRQYLRTTPEPDSDDPNVLHAHGRMLLARAYADFVHSTPLQEKVFSVFRAANEQHVSLATLRATLPSQDHRS